MSIIEKINNRLDSKRGYVLIRNNIEINQLCFKVILTANRMNNGLFNFVLT